MNALDIAYCMDRADAADPFRGVDWYDTFLDAAYELGYKIVDGEPCFCYDGVNHDPDCGMVRRRENDRRVWPWDDNPPGQDPTDLDGLIEPSARERGWVYHPRRNMPYVDAAGWHRHRCSNCGTIWAHRTPEDISVIARYHRCARCGGESEDGFLGYERYCGPDPPAYFDWRDPNPPKMEEPEPKDDGRFRHLREAVRDVAQVLYDVIFVNTPPTPGRDSTEESNDVR